MINEELSVQIEREKLLRRAQQITSDPKATKAQLKEADVLLAQAATLKTRSQMLAKLNAVRREDGLPEIALEERSEENLPAVEKAFRTYLRTGHATHEIRELRTAASTDPASWGFTIPSQWAGQYLARLVSYSGIREAGANIVPTKSAGAFQYPFSDDSGNNGVRVTENTQINSFSPLAGLNTLNAFPYSSQGIVLTNSLADDVGFDLSSYLQDLGAKRIGRITNTEFTLGAVGGPSGVIPGLSVGVTSASPTAVLVSELNSLVASLDTAYRLPEAKPCFMFSPGVEAQLKSMLTAQGARVFPEMDEGKLLGYRYVLNVDMAASLSASAKAIAYGSFLRGVTIREVSPVLIVSKERLAEFAQTYFAMFHRQDCVIADPNAVKLLQMHA